MITAILAVASRQATKTAGASAPVHFPQQSELLTWCQDMGVGTCILIALMGIAYLLYGWSMFKPLLTLNAAIIGGYIGVILGARAGGYEVPGGVIGAVAAAAIAWPMMQWTVAVTGGVCGAFVGASIWMISGQDPNYAWAGALTGLVGFGMLSFILFRGSIIMYTSLQGGVMLIFGLLGLAFKYNQIAPTIFKEMKAQPLVFPIAVLIPTVLGLIYQQKTSPAGSPAGGSGGDAKKK